MQIVAAENFWGSLVSQLGGTQVNVLSIVSDPNADPHEYEASEADAEAFSAADYIIVNGVGYDSWAFDLISAESNSNPNQKILDVQNITGVPDGGNPHQWYNPTYVNETVYQMYLDLVSLDPANTTYFTQQYVNLNASLGEYNSWITTISQQFNGTEVASTESIFQWTAESANLDLVSPYEFMEAVAEGNDPSEASIVTFENQIESGDVKVMAFNNQTITPLTTQMQNLAKQYNVALVQISETIQPPTMRFQDSMTYELISLYNALKYNETNDPTTSTPSSSIPNYTLEPLLLISTLGIVGLYLNLKRKLNVRILNN